MTTIPVETGSITSTGPAPERETVNWDDIETNVTFVEGSLGFEKRDIIGADNRFLQVKTGNPWDYIGRFQFEVEPGKLKICTGSLVGPRHLLTAYHCYDQALAHAPYEFKPNFDQGDRGYTTAQVTNVLDLNPGGMPNRCDKEKDWTVMILNQRIGDKYGYFGVKAFDDSKAGKPDFWHEGRIMSSRP